MAKTRSAKGSTGGSRGSSGGTKKKSSGGGRSSGGARGGRSSSTRSSGKRASTGSRARASGSSSRGSGGGGGASGSQMTTDHDEIRRWAEQRGAKPTCVLGTGGGGDEGVLRLDFPGYSGDDSLHEISWDEWFEKFDQANLALLYQDTTKGGQTSNFNKLVSRSQAKGSTRGRGRGK